MDLVDKVIITVAAIFDLKSPRLMSYGFRDLSAKSKFLATRGTCANSDRLLGVHLATLKVPSDAADKSIHVISEITDNGTSPFRLSQNHLHAFQMSPSEIFLVFLTRFQRARR